MRILKEQEKWLLKQAALLGKEYSPTKLLEMKQQAGREITGEFQQEMNMLKYQKESSLAGLNPGWNEEQETLELIDKKIQRLEGFLNRAKKRLAQHEAALAKLIGKSLSGLEQISKALSRNVVSSQV